MRVDPVTFEVVNNALVGVAEQMAATILRTSYSTVIREMLDYSTAVFDLDGRIIAQSCRIPIHLNSMSRSLRTTLDESIPIGEWEEGDIVVTNDPYKGGQHLPDIQTFLPVFHQGTLVAICGTLGHHLDVGGMRPGSYAGEAVEIYQEGLRIPPIKLFERGRLNERLFDLIGCNIRLPDITIGDLRSQTAALEIGRDGVIELIDRYGADTLRACMEEATVASEARLRARIRELPEGRYEGTYFVDDDGVLDEPIRIVTTLTIEDGSIHVDFTGTDPQRRSPINATLSSCESATYFAVLSILDPTIPANYGVYRPIRITAPEGTVVNALPPAPVVGRNAITHTIVNALTIALSEVVPERITAAYYGMSNVYILSGDSGPDGRGWIFFDIEVGGGGGRPGQGRARLLLAGDPQPRQHPHRDGGDDLPAAVHPLRVHPGLRRRRTFPRRARRTPGHRVPRRARRAGHPVRQVQGRALRAVRRRRRGDGAAGAQSGRPGAAGTRLQDGRPGASPRRRGEHVDPGRRRIRRTRRAEARRPSCRTSAKASSPPKAAQEHYGYDEAKDSPNVGLRLRPT